MSLPVSTPGAAERRTAAVKGTIGRSRPWEVFGPVEGER